MCSVENFRKLSFSVRDSKFPIHLNPSVFGQPASRSIDLGQQMGAVRRRPPDRDPQRDDFLFAGKASRNRGYSHGRSSKEVEHLLGLLGRAVVAVFTEDQATNRNRSLLDVSPSGPVA